MVDRPPLKWGKLAKCSQDTALRDIDDLLGRGILGTGRSGRRSNRAGHPLSSPSQAADQDIVEFPRAPVRNRVLTRGVTAVGTVPVAIQLSF